MSRVWKFFKRPPRDPHVDDDADPPSPFEYWWARKTANWETNNEIKEDKRRLERSQSVIARPPGGSKIVKKPPS